MAIDSSTRKCINKDDDCVEIETTTLIISNNEKTTLPFEEDGVYYSIIDSPVVCKPNEQIDKIGRCRIVY